MTEFGIDIRVNPQPARTGIRQVGRGLEGLQRQSFQLGKTIGSAFDPRKPVNFGKGVEDATDEVSALDRVLGRVALTLGGIVTLRGFANLSDSATQLANRLSVVEGSASEAIEIQQALSDVALETRSSLDATGQVYTRLALNQDELNRTSRELLDITTTLNQAVRISGATSEESRNALIQLSQGLASGALRGDELRSVLEQLPAVSKIIADEFGVSTGQLRALGEEGLLTTERILEALENAGPEVAEQFDRTNATIGESLEGLRTAGVGVADLINRTTGASEAFAQAVSLAADTLNELTRASREAQKAQEEFTELEQRAAQTGAAAAAQRSQREKELRNILASVGFQEDRLSESQRERIEFLERVLGTLPAATKAEEDLAKAVKETADAQDDANQSAKEAARLALARRAGRGDERRARQEARARREQEAARRQEEAFLDRIRESEQRLNAERLEEDERRRREASDQTFGRGIREGFADIRAEAENLNVLGRDLTNLFADNLTGAAIAFAEEGSEGLREFGDEAARQLQRILIRALAIQALNLLLPGSGTVAGSTGLLNAGAQFGAVVQPGQAPRPVNEDGRPETFLAGRTVIQPRQTGTVVPNPANQAAAPVTVTPPPVVVVMDPAMVATAIQNDPNAQDAIVLAVNNNQDRIQSLA